MEWIAGVDEVGRGPLAGPVTIGVVLFKKKDIPILKKMFSGVRDSKKLQKEKREEWVSKINLLVKKRYLRFATASSNEKIIDKQGIVKAIHRAIRTGLFRARVPVGAHILLDGGIYAPKKYLKQTTIIRGDEKELSIMLASIIAKVKRDKRMARLGKKYPKYGFEKHSGYGTKEHIQALKKHGLSAIHRKTFCRGI